MLGGREENGASPASKRQEMTKPCICWISTDLSWAKCFLTILRVGRLFQPLSIALIF